MQMNKEKYEVPLIEIINFEAEDIITTSGGTDEGEVDIDLFGLDLLGLGLKDN